MAQRALGCNFRYLLSLTPMMAGSVEVASCRLQLLGSRRPERVEAVASILRRYRSSGGSLALAVAFRMLSLPMFAAVAVAFVINSRAAGAATFCWLLGVELAARRRRWTWQRLNRLPAIDAPGADQADAHRLTLHYFAGTSVLGIALAFGPVSAGKGVEHLSEIGGIALAIGSALAGHLVFEHRVRSRNPTLRRWLSDDEALNVGEMGLLVMLLPKRWWRGGATFAALGMTVILGGMFGLMIVAGGVDASWTDPTVYFMMPVGMTFVALSAGLLSVIEANNAASFIEAHGSPTPEPTSS